MPRFSVITITRNDLAGLKKTTQSLVDQLFTDHEHVIVDGASTDGTPQWIEQYAATAEQPVRWVSEPDRGIYDGMNKGIRMAQGDYVVFMNSADRFYSPLTLQFVADKLAATGARWMFGQLQFVDADDTLVEVTAQQSFGVARQARGHGFSPHQATYMERHLLQDELQAFDESFSYAADQELCLRAGMIATPLVVPDYLGIFLAGGTHSKASGWQRENLYRAMREKNGLVLGGHDVLDRGFTIGTAGYRDGRRLLARTYRSLRTR